MAHLLVEETDNWIALRSEYFSFDPNKAVIIKSRIKVAYSKNLKDKFYFYGYFGLSPKTSLSDDVQIKHTKFFGVRYVNYDYESKYSDGTIEEQKAEGFFLVRNGGEPTKKSSLPK